MKMLIPYIIVFIAGFIVSTAIFPIEKEKVVTQTEIIPEPNIAIEDTGKIEYVVLDPAIIDSLKLLGKTEWLKVFAPDTIKDTIKITGIDTVYITKDSLIYVSYDTTFEDTSCLSIELWFNPKTLIHLWDIQYSGRKSYKEILTQYIKPKWTFEMGILAGYLGGRQYRTGVSGSLFYKTIGGTVYIDNLGLQFGINKRW